MRTQTILKVLFLAAMLYQMYLGIRIGLEIDAIENATAGQKITPEMLAHVLSGLKEKMNVMVLMVLLGLWAVSDKCNANWRKY